MIDVYTSKKLGTMVTVSTDEAIEIIESLSAQTINKNPNTGRREFKDKNGAYFSIAVEPNKVKKAFLCDKRCINRYQKCEGCFRYSNFQPMPKDRR